MAAKEAYPSSRELLLNKCDLESSQLETQSEQAELQPTGSKPVQVLIADPDESLLAKYRGHSRDGFEVVTAANGVECVNRLRQRAPDIFVLEPKMHWGGGHGVLAMMHDVLDLADVPVMLLTSCSDSVLDLVSRFPICDYHPKPMEPVELVQRLQTILEERVSRCNNFAKRQLRLESRLKTLIANEAGGRASWLYAEPVSVADLGHHDDS